MYRKELKSTQYSIGTTLIYTATQVIYVYIYKILLPKSSFASHLVAYTCNRPFFLMKIFGFSVGHLFISTIGLAFGFPLNPKAVAEDEKLLSTSLQTIESFWLEVEGDGPFLLGNSKPSIADPALVCEIMQIEVADENDRERMLGPDKKVLKWIVDRKRLNFDLFVICDQLDEMERLD
ncbi:hypothetical protein BUALT_Bualt14G0077500 [Buddleja alternifolia]|uniref:Uncharacterized protein n=1 Tax=Buddleja alternifolia TaxID=168488 RepID=A0AAV6WR60_9LAMI|nr:hypothetical protein BUALT_Bualt14G0077500 [Buddleja alternifolia]